MNDLDRDPVAADTTPWEEIAMGMVRAVWEIASSVAGPLTR